jgi:hypothetical protein
MLEGGFFKGSVMKRLAFHSILLGIVTIGMSNSSSGGVITDPSQLSPNPTIIDFEQFGTQVPNPLVIGNATFSSSGEFQIINISGQNLVGDAAESNVLREGTIAPIEITFVDPISEVLVGSYDPSFSGNLLQAFDINDQLLEQSEVPFGSPNPSFVLTSHIGFRRSLADIKKIVAFPVPPDPDVSRPPDDYGLDNIHYNTSPVVPEPTSLTLLGIGVAGLFGYGLRRKRIVGYR